jgi:hypothetical protein
LCNARLIARPLKFVLAALLLLVGRVMIQSRAIVGWNRMPGVSGRGYASWRIWL